MATPDITPVQAIRSLANNDRLIGWREYVGLPDMQVSRLKAKVDTGALTSALHVNNLEFFEKAGRPWVRFHPPRDDSSDAEQFAEARVRDQREVKNSGGQIERRCVIATQLVIGPQSFTIEVTLTNRDDMVFAMLLGRTAMRIGKLLVDPRKSWLAGEPRF